MTLRPGHGALRTLVAAGAVASTLAVGLEASAEPVVVDRAVVRFIASETGGVSSPRFIFERVLAFEARLEALADPDSARRQNGNGSYRERHVRAALERHISETLLSSLRIEPEPTAAELSRRTEAARRILVERSGGELAFRRAQKAEGIDDREVFRILRRQARASLYLDRMVAPMLEPSDAELRNIHRTARTPFRGAPYERIEASLRRWYVAQRFEAALGTFYQNVRSRLRVTILTK